MKDFEKIRQVLNDRGIKQIELVNHLNMPRSNISSWLSGKRGIPKDKLIEIANFLNISINYFLDDAADTKPVVKVPIVGSTSCGSTGMNTFQDEGAFCYYNGEFWSKDLYCVIASGDSMAPDIEDGDEIICDPNVLPEHGDMVHYTLHNESAVKVLVKNEEAGIISLKPYNPSADFKARIIRIDDDEINYLKMNKVIAVNKLKFNNRAARLRLVGE